MGEEPFELEEGPFSFRNNAGYKNGVKIVSICALNNQGKMPLNSYYLY